MFVINPGKESIDTLVDIKVGKEVSERILNEMKHADSALPNGVIHPLTMDRYFQYYWNGYSRRGRKVGNGVYIALVSINDIKKVLWTNKINIAVKN